MMRVLRVLTVLALVSATFALAPVSAQAAPHYYVNGGKVKEGEGSTKASILWGTIRFTGTKGVFLGGHVTCHVAAGATLFNPVGGGSGEGVFQQYAPYACEQELICPIKTTVVQIKAENLPWHNLLTEEVAATIRQETTGVKLNIKCFEGNTLVAERKVVPAEKEKSPRPKTVEGTEALHPSFLEYGEASGELELEASGGGNLLKPEGVLKLLGYNAQELIAVKNP